MTTGRTACGRQQAARPQWALGPVDESTVAMSAAAGLEADRDPVGDTPVPPFPFDGNGRFGPASSRQPGLPVRPETGAVIVRGGERRVVPIARRRHPTTTTARTVSGPSSGNCPTDDVTRPVTSRSKRSDAPACGCRWTDSRGHANATVTLTRRLSVEDISEEPGAGVVSSLPFAESCVVP
jgi:hypothetical protein